MAKGKFAYGQRVQPVKWDIGTDLLNSEDQEFKHRAEDRIIADRESAKKAAQAEANKKRGEDYATALGKVKLNDSGIKSHDERIMDIYLRKGGIRDRFNDYYNRLEKNPSDKEAIAGLKNLEGMAEKINLATKGWTAKRNALTTGLQEGTFSTKLNKGLFEKFNKTIDEIEYQFDFDENEQIVIKTPKFDKNGDGIINELDTFTVQEILDPNKLTGIKKWDLKTWATEAKERYGKKTDNTNNGKNVGFDISKLPALKSEIDGVMGDSIETITDAGKSLIADWNNVDDWENVTNEQFTAYKDDLAQRTVNMYETERGNKTDYQGLNYSLNRQKYEDKKAKEQQETPGYGITLNVDENGKEVKVPIKGGEGANKAAYSFVVDPTQVKEVLIGKNRLRIQEFFLSEDGEISYKGTSDELINNEWKTTIVNGGGLNKTELSLVARANGFQDSEAFRKHLESVRDAKLGNKQNSNSKVDEYGVPIE